MKCLVCGNEISNNYATCPYCGASKAENTDEMYGGGESYGNQYDVSANNSPTAFCVMCGRSIPSGYKMCPECTEARGAAASPSTTSSSRNTGLMVVAIVAAVLTLLCSAVVIYAWSNGMFDGDSDTASTQVVEVTNDDDAAEKQKAEEEARLKAEEEARLKAEEEARLKAEEEAKRKAEEEAKKAKYVGYNPGYAITWSAAEAAAAQKGGNLACPESWEEFEQIKQAAEAAGLTKIWLGVKRTGESWYSGVYTDDGSSSVYTCWLPGEPSYYDKDKLKNSNVRVDEYYLMAFKQDGVWYMNDVANDVSYAYKNVGYIVEK